MTRFVDGPAAGTTLMLKRAPRFLRAVQVPGGAWDALDQLDDVPKSDETIVVYRMDGESTFCHINRDRRHGGSGFFRGGAYKVVEPQPSHDAVRSTSAWRAWVGEQVGQPIGDDGGVRQP